jgi:hypothetical protein
MGIPLDWIFDRLFVSLVIATLINRNSLADSPKWRGFIEPLELWLAGAPADLERDLERPDPHSVGESP